MIADMLIDVTRYRIRVGMVEYSAALTQQLRVHNQVTLIVVIGGWGILVPWPKHKRPRDKPRSPVRCQR
ncbi:hypothetical protein D3C85_1714420 [compost metagenome]